MRRPSLMAAWRYGMVLSEASGMNGVSRCLAASASIAAWSLFHAGGLVIR
jgi:hypothetical protein